jgi:hypothetical protein
MARAAFLDDVGFKKMQSYKLRFEMKLERTELTRTTIKYDRQQLSMTDNSTHTHSTKFNLNPVSSFEYESC